MLGGYSRQRLLLKLIVQMSQCDEFVADMLNGVPYPTVLPIQVRNVPIGGGQHAYVIFASSDVVVALLTTPVAVQLLERFGVSLVVVDDYKVVLSCRLLMQSWGRKWPMVPKPKERAV